MIFDDLEIPGHWCMSTIGEIAIYIQRGKSPKYADLSDLPVINQKCVRWEGIDERYLKFIDPRQWTQWGPERYLRSGDVLWNSTGTGTIGRATVFRGLATHSRAVADSHVTIVRVAEYDPELLHLWIRSPWVQSRIEDMQSGSTNQVELSRSEVEATLLPVPPREEQQRIASKVNACLDRVAGVRELLHRAQTTNDRLRQSILAAAFRGDLTAEWREQNPDVEPASVLLNRIRKERRERWEQAELVRMQAKGKTPTRGGWRKKYAEPEPIDPTDLPDLPESWCWARWGDISEWITYGFTRPMPHVTADGPPIITARHIFNGEINFSDFHRTTAAAFEGLSDKDRPQPGDILITKDGSIGRAAVVTSDMEAFCINQSVAVMYLRSCALDRKYLLRVIEAPFTQSAIADQARGMALRHLSITDFAALPFPLAPIEEQFEVARLTSAALSCIVRVTELIGDSEARIRELEKAILAEAFRGGLVKPDPNDEPASEQLARIRAANAGVAVSRTNPRVRTRRPHEDSKKEVGMLTRQDVPPNHLSLLLTDHGALTAEALWNHSKLEIDEFYDQLKDEEARGLLIERRRDGASAPRLLEASA